MTRTIEVGPPDVSEVRVGTIWRLPERGSDRTWQLLVLPAFDSEVFNVAYQLEAPGEQELIPSMLHGGIIATVGELIACPLPGWVEQIEQLYAEALRGRAG